MGYDKIRKQVEILRVRGIEKHESLKEKRRQESQLVILEEVSWRGVQGCTWPSARYLIGAALALSCSLLAGAGGDPRARRDDRDSRDNRDRGRDNRDGYRRDDRGAPSVAPLRLRLVTLCTQEGATAEASATDETRETATAEGIATETESATGTATRTKTGSQRRRTKRHAEICKHSLSLPLQYWQLLRFSSATSPSSATRSSILTSSGLGAERCQRRAMTPWMLVSSFRCSSFVFCISGGHRLNGSHVGYCYNGRGLERAALSSPGCRSRGGGYRSRSRKAMLAQVSLSLYPNCAKLSS